jgi:hypothetical protein
LVHCPPLLAGVDDLAEKDGSIGHLGLVEIDAKRMYMWRSWVSSDDLTVVLTIMLVEEHLNLTSTEIATNK